MIKFAHIAPTAYLDQFAQYNQVHLILAHLVEQDEEYGSFYANLNDGKPKIMDNSAFEMYKMGRPMYPAEDLIGMGKLCKADMIVMSDYPGEPSYHTIGAAINSAEEIKSEGFQTFFVPQSRVGDLEDFLMCIQWALKTPDLIDRIGLSILGCPNAYGVERGNKLERYLSRLQIFKEMERRGMLIGITKPIFHCLGMTEGPREIELLQPWKHLIASWDSSAAIWAGINNIEFDYSLSGLVNGKVEGLMDFEHKSISLDQLDSIKHNIEYINYLRETL